MSDNNYKAPKLAYTVDCLIMLAEQGEVLVVDGIRHDIVLVSEGGAQ